MNKIRNIIVGAMIVFSSSVKCPHVPKAPVAQTFGEYLTQKTLTNLDQLPFDWIPKIIRNFLATPGNAGIDGITNASPKLDPFIVALQKKYVLFSTTLNGPIPEDIEELKKGRVIYTEGDNAYALTSLSIVSKTLHTDQYGRQYYPGFEIVQPRSSSLLNTPLMKNLDLKAPFAFFDGNRKLAKASIAHFCREIPEFNHGFVIISGQSAQLYPIQGESFTDLAMSLQTMSSNIQAPIDLVLMSDWFNSVQVTFTERGDAEKTETLAEFIENNQLKPIGQYTKFSLGFASKEIDLLPQRMPQAPFMHAAPAAVPQEAKIHVSDITGYNSFAIDYSLDGLVNALKEVLKLHKTPMAGATIDQSLASYYSGVTVFAKRTGQSMMSGSLPAFLGDVQNGRYESVVLRFNGKDTHIVTNSRLT